MDGADRKLVAPCVIFLYYKFGQPVWVFGLQLGVIPPFLMKLVMLNLVCHFLMANDFGEKPAENYSSKITSLALFLFFALEGALRVL